MGAEFDFSEVMQLAADLEEAPKNLPKYLRKSLEVTARKVKNAARDKVKGREMLSQAAAAIDYELDGYTGPTSGMSAEVGYRKGFGAGALGNLVEFGAPRAREVILVKSKGGVYWLAKKDAPIKALAPGMELQRSLHENEDDFQRGVEAALDDAMKEVNL